MRDVAAGRGVKRADHALTDESGADRSAHFIDALRAEGYAATTVADREVALGERVPAWLVADGMARFGWIFWERFTAERARKLWGTVHKNAKGDWDRTLGARSRTTLYANPAARERVDPDNPSSW